MMKVTEEQPYRSASLMNNRKNNHPDGMKGPKKMKTKATEFQSNIYLFNFVIMWDENGFYIKLSRRSGDATHQYHPHFSEMSITISYSFIDKGIY